LNRERRGERVWYDVKRGKDLVNNVPCSTTNTVDIVYEGQSTGVMDTEKSLAESDEEGRSLDHPSALMDPGLGSTGHYWSWCPP
jgi:hypothetical protein